MDTNRLNNIIDWMTSQPVRELEMHDGEWSVHLVKSESGIQANPRPLQPAPVEKSAPQPEPEDGQIVSTPLYGVLHLAPDPASAMFVSVGDTVKAGQALCLVESMKVFNTITADRDAVVTAILASDGAEVAAGQPLIRLESVKTSYV